MIENLNGIHETVKYKEYSNVKLFINAEAEDYPIHWHTPMEIIMPAAELGIEPSDCELVEDTYRILLQTVTEGIKSTHITTILTGGCER